MDAEAIFKLVDSGGALGAFVVLSGYLAYQNKVLWRRNDTLHDRQHAREVKDAERLTALQHAIERLGDKFNAS